jgi:HD-like signal output (HDOD) protein
MKKRILFVDDEPRVLQGLQRMLRSMRDQWEMTFVGSGEKALEALAKAPFDVIVTDMRMPTMSGAELLNQVMTLYPSTMRFMMSGHSDKQMILRSVGSAHQYLSKSCSAAALKTAVARTCSLRTILTDESLGNLVAQLPSLPSLPKVYVELMEELKSEDASMRKIGEIVSRDIGMTAKILQVVNSAFFGLPRRASDPAQAANLLGLDIIRGLMLSVHVFSEFKDADSDSFSPASLWRHSITVGAFAKRIAELENCDQDLVSDALGAGLLHDAGKLILAANLPRKYSAAMELARRENIPVSEAEYASFGATHAEVGAYLLGLWAFPDALVEALASHHAPERCPVPCFSALTAVHAADALDSELNPDAHPGRPPQVDVGYLEALGMIGNYAVWRDACQSLDQEEEIDDECRSPASTAPSERHAPSL